MDCSDCQWLLKRKKIRTGKSKIVLMMNSKIAQTRSSVQFKRRFGVQPDTFKHIVKAVKPAWRATAKPGVKPKLSIEERVLIALEYWREYRTYFHIGSSWGVSESTVCRIVHWLEDRLMALGQFRLPGKKQLVRGFGQPTVVVMDVTETPIERPKRYQRWFYSGKKKQHTLKCQLVIELCSGRIICTYYGKGRRHDFKLFQASGFTSTHKLKACRTRGIRVSKNYMPTVVYLTRNPEADNLYHFI